MFHLGSLILLTYLCFITLLSMYIVLIRMYQCMYVSMYIVYIDLFSCKSV